MAEPEPTSLTEMVEGIEARLTEMRQLAREGKLLTDEYSPRDHTAELKAIKATLNVVLVRSKMGPGYEADEPDAPADPGVQRDLEAGLSRVADRAAGGGPEEPTGT